MSDSSFTGATSPASLLQSGIKPREQSAPTVQIIHVSDDVRDSGASTHKGRVDRRDHNGDVHIKTDKGEITIRPPSDVPLKEGDSVEIRLPPPSDPSQTAKLNVQRRAAPQTTTQQSQHQNITNAEYIKIIETLSVPKAPLPINEPIQLTKLTPAQIKNIVPVPMQDLPLTTAQIITQPPFMGASLIDDLPDLITTAIEPPPLTSAQPMLYSLPPPTLSQFPPIEIATPLTPQSPLETIPFRNVAAQILKIPSQALITAPPSTEITPPAIPILAEAIITQITPFTPDFASQSLPILLGMNGEQSQAFTHPSLPHYAQAGEIEAQIVGLTPEREFPVLKIIAPPLNTEHFYALPIRASDISKDSILSLSGSFTPPQSDSAALNLSQTATINAVITPLPPMLFSQILPLWDTLEQINQTLQEHAPQTAQSFAAMTPNTSAPARMSGTALFFIAALRSGDMQSWLGDRAVDALKKAGKSELLSRFMRETGELRRAENANTEWRSTSFPIMNGENLHRVLLHYRKEHHERADDSPKGEGTTRFVMDLALSNMGKIQLDGLFQGSESKGIGRLDLILRTEHPFTQSMHADMRQLYKSALDETSYTGELSFQSTPEHWVKISPTSPLGNFSKNI